MCLKRVSVFLTSCRLCAAGLAIAALGSAHALSAADVIVSRGAGISWNGARMFDHGCEVLIDGRTSGTENMVWGHWNDAREVTVDLDLRSGYLISKVRVWSVEHLGLRGIRDFMVLLGNDGTNFTQVARFESPLDFDGGLSHETRTTVPRECVLENPSVARFARVIVHRHPGRHQQILGEIEVFGSAPPVGAADALRPENNRPFVKLRADGFSSGACAFDWNGYPSAGDVKAWRLYACDRDFGDVREDGVSFVAETKADVTTYTVFPLKPNAKRHYAVAPVFADGEYPRVKAIAHAPIGPLQVTRFRDMLGVNFFWNGGGAFEKTGPVWWDVAADFLSRSHFRKLRWWIAPEWAMKRYMPRRIEVNPWTGQKDVAVKYGLYLHDIGNEPELRPGYTPEKYVADCRAAREQWKDAGPDHRFYGPVVNISEAGFKYLKGFIEADGARYVDAIDLHTYCGATAEFRYPAGYPAGSPEAIIPRVAEIRAYLASKGVDKPLTCSEWGYSDTKTANPHMADPTPLRKAQYLVRGFIIHHALGFRRVYMYSFYDEGTDPNFSEHSFGILSRDLQKKPAYYALETMGRVLGDALCESGLGNLGPGDFGYRFRNVDGPGFVTAVWNGARNRKGVFRTRPGEVEIVDMFGASRRLRTKDDGTFLARFGSSPVYFRSSSPVEVVSTADAAVAEPEVSDRLVVSSEALAVFNADESPKVAFLVKNPLKERVEMMLTLKNFAGATIVERRAVVDGGATSRFEFPFDVKGAALDKALLSVDYDADGESFCENRGIWVRRLGGGTRFANLPYPVKVLGNDELEITVDPVQGGQVLEIWEKRGKTNQLTIDYDQLPTVSSIVFAYGLWQGVGIQPNGGTGLRAMNFRRKTRFSAEETPAGLVLAAEDHGVKVIRTLALDGRTFSWKTEVVNGCGEDIRFRAQFHPEYTIAGTADSYQDYMLFPADKEDAKLVFWSGLGARRLEKMTAGWWRMVDPRAGFEIRQTYDFSAFEVPKLWFGIGAWNVEMFTPITDLKNGERASFTLNWEFQHTKKGFDR